MAKVFMVFFHTLSLTWRTIQSPSPSTCDIPQALKNSVGFVGRQAAHTQCPNLTPFLQPLQPDGYFPSLGLLQDKDIFLAFLVSDACTNDVEATQLRALQNVSIINDTAITIATARP
ncbi:hypothetical protein I7I50_12243 [Histoplasma capsulatum G186AR]|uniref:Uncharacterized protein n=1 Tax=Ajellomyces capsulatus TaxID=5037 RepID=A0A8H7Y8D8_AJECA|nr:hypothetical protein I7I52_11445 [Histoplasma capsulatum]QSS70566.1 hypothetical protein I7I50_12243 [Histoplasma capsulatum G186AR]